MADLEGPIRALFRSAASLVKIIKDSSMPEVPEQTDKPTTQKPKEPNMDFGLLIQYKLVVNPVELRLISKGLRGALDGDDIKAAGELQEKLMLERAKQADQFAREAGKAKANIQGDE